MKLVKSLLLGTAAGLCAAAGVQAADLPSKKAAAVEYVRVCSTLGEGFFYIPGTETCLKIGGRVRADYLYAEPLTRANDAIGFRARGRIQLDARTTTAYGLLRSVVRMEITRNSGTPFTDTGRITTSPDIAQAFIQFGGLTAGRVTTFFDNSDLPTEHMGTLRFSDAPDVDLLAYTFTFGNGFSATLSIEDGIERRSNGFLDDPTVATLDYGGQRAPDVVGALKYTGTWGTAQLSAALHQIRSNNLFVTLPGGVCGIADDFPDTRLRLRGAGQRRREPADARRGRCRLDQRSPMRMARSATSRAVPPIRSAPACSRASWSMATSTRLTGNISTGRGWSVAGGLRHYWTPTVRQSVFGSYARFDYSASRFAVRHCRLQRSSASAPT